MSYLNIAEVESAIANLAAAYPSLTSLVTLPHASIEGRISHALRISTGGFGSRDAFVAIGGVHAREWGSCEILINVATDLLKAYTANAGLKYGGKSYAAKEIQDLMNSIEFVFFPLVNPDGRKFSQDHDAAVLDGWRKNRNKASSGGSAANIGVDINRNYDFLWDFATKMAPSAPGASANPGSETFHGTAPFSEPETANVRWLVEMLPRCRWFMDIHSYSELILYNWGHDQNQSTDPSKNFRNAMWDGKRGVAGDTYAEYIPADDEAVAAGLAGRMRDAIAAVRGKTYSAEPSFALYPTSGASDDYVYSRHWINPAKGKIYGFVVEWGMQFHPPWAEMELIIDDVTAGLLALCSAAPCAGGVSAIALLTPSLNFVDVPALTETARALVFSVQSCQAVTFQVSAGPTLSAGPGSVGLPLGGIVALPAAPTAATREVRLWVSYRAGAAGTMASGSVTVTCPQTGGSWVIPIAANAVPKPSVASILVLDRSGSMDWASGLPGKRRIDVLHDAAPTFVELLGDLDAIGVVSFDSNASLTTPLAQAGALGFGAGRVAAKNAIANHLTNLAGSTSIGDGVELGHDTLLTVAGYDRKAVVVFTDGEENTPKFIDDVASKINDRVYAIGLGTASELNPIALNKLVSNTGGYLMLTGPLTASEQFRLAKYYLQILSGVVNSQIVVDPDGYLGPKTVVRVPFDLTEGDTLVDVILLSPWRQVINFAVETPGGDIVDPSVVPLLVDSSFVAGSSLDAFRLSLPAIWPTHSAHCGRWHVLLSLGRKPADLFRDNTIAAAGAVALAAHGVPYSVSVHAQSSLTMEINVMPHRLAPPTLIDHHVALRQLGIPLNSQGEAVLEASDPNGIKTVIPMAPTATPGEFVVQTPAPIAGVYTFRYLGRGVSFSGLRFMREQLRTVGIWVGGDAAPPKGEPGCCACRGECCCTELLKALLQDRGMQQVLSRLEIDSKRIAGCLEQGKGGASRRE